MKASTLNRAIVGSSLILAVALLGVNYQQNRIIQSQRVVLRMLLNDSASLAQCKVSHEKIATGATAPASVLVKFGDAGLPAVTPPAQSPRPGS